MKLSLFSAALLISSTAAFAPPVAPAAAAVKPLQVTKSIGSGSSFDSEMGAIKPVGFFDPIGLTKNIDDAKFNQYRAGEIKNGRVAMLAVIGYIVPEFCRFPGELAPGLAFDDIPNGLAAINVIPGAFWIATFFVIGSVDFLNSDASGYHECASVDMDPEDMERRRISEISNGRLAMLAFWELVRQDITTNGGAGGHLVANLPGFLFHHS